MARNLCTGSEVAEVQQITADSAVTASICSTINVGAVGVTEAVLQWTVQNIRSGQQRDTEIEYGLDTHFLLSSAYQVC